MSLRERILREQLRNSFTVSLLEDGEAHIFCPYFIRERLTQSFRDAEIRHYMCQNIFGERTVDEIIASTSLESANEQIDAVVAAFPLPQLPNA